MTSAFLVGDALGQLRTLPDRSVRCCVTSPPYWGLRDYGVPGQLGLEPTPEQFVDNLVAIFREVRRVLADDGTLWLNLGDSYAPSGSNKGQVVDSMRKPTVRSAEHDPASGKQGYLQGTAVRPALPPGLKPKDLVGVPWRVAFALQADGWWLRSDIIWSKPNPMPESIRDRPTRSHEYLFLLTKSARYFYNGDAIREKQVTDYNGDGRHPIPPAGWAQQGLHTSLAHNAGTMDERQARARRLGVSSDGYDARKWKDRSDGRSRPPMTMRDREYDPRGRNRRTVWTIPTHAFRAAHFATFPPKLVRPCILAGTQAAGKRCDCDEEIRTPLGTAAPGDDRHQRLTNGRAGMARPRPEDEGVHVTTRRQQRHDAAELEALSEVGRDVLELEAGGAETFAHYVRTDRGGARALPPELRATWAARGWLTEAPPCDHADEGPDTVLDPFAGAGTTGLVASRLGRSFVGIELNPEYAALARRRLHLDAPLFHPE